MPEVITCERTNKHTTFKSSEQLNDLYTPMMNTDLQTLLVKSKCPGDYRWLQKATDYVCVCTLYIWLTMQINNRNCGQIKCLYLKDVYFGWKKKIGYFDVLFNRVIILKGLLTITLTLHYITQQKYCQVSYFTWMAVYMNGYQ